MDKIQGSSTYSNMIVKVELPTSKMMMLTQTDLYLLLKINFPFLLNFAAPSCSSWLSCVFKASNSSKKAHLTCCLMNCLHLSTSILAAQPIIWQKCDLIDLGNVRDQTVNYHQRSKVAVWRHAASNSNCLIQTKVKMFKMPEVDKLVDNVLMFLTFDYFVLVSVGPSGNFTPTTQLPSSANTSSALNPFLKFCIAAKIAPLTAASKRVHARSMLLSFWMCVLVSRRHDDSWTEAAGWAAAAAVLLPARLLQRGQVHQEGEEGQTGGLSKVS